MKNFHDSIFNAAIGHIPMALEKLPAARILWINPKFKIYDSNIDRHLNLGEYETHLLNKCAYASINNLNDNNLSINAFADRYGGFGIGCNGGSGRAAYINGYYVKGIGPTPLVGKTADKIHSTGFIELNACIKESIISECVELEFPWGGVPTLAIIGTGIFKNEKMKKSSELCLLVRPAFLRPAHFDRASFFLSALPIQGFHDSRRVKSMIMAAVKNFGAIEFKNIWHNLHERWAEQLAYGFAHRFCHGGESPSNIAIDGRLLDFGSMTTLPTWGKARTTINNPVSGHELPIIINALRSIILQINYHNTGIQFSQEELLELSEFTVKCYSNRVLIEVLRVLGLDLNQAKNVMGSDSGKIAKGINKIIIHYFSEYYTTFEYIPKSKKTWNLTDFWSGACDEISYGLKNELIHAFDKSKLCFDLDRIKKINQKTAKTRFMLFHDQLWNSINSFTDNELIEKSALNKFIINYVENNSFAW